MTSRAGAGMPITIRPTHGIEVFHTKYYKYLTEQKGQQQCNEKDESNDI